MLRYRIAALIVAAHISVSATAQELFVYSEPASNMPARSAGIRLTNWIMNNDMSSRVNYHMIPEIMWGANKNLMLHTEAYFSNNQKGLAAEGLGFYAKYRFFAKDRIYRHFRMAAFVRAATNNNAIHQEEIAVNGYNTGYQTGLIATQLLHKTALSFTGYYEHVFDNTGHHEIPMGMANEALNYTLSAGRLLWPKTYTGYKQTNINAMAEVLGQKLLGNDKQFADCALSVQFIFNSQTRLDIGYKFELYGNVQRTAPNGLLVRVEHLLYHVI